MKKSARVAGGVYAVLLFTILAACSGAVRQGNWIYVGQSIGTAAVISLPYLLEAGRRLAVPPVTKMIMMLFAFCGLFLGSTNGFYDNYFWWDLVLHTLSGPACGIIIYSIILRLREKPDGKSGLTHGMSLLLVFCFIMTFGTIWEIVEFTLDNTLGMHMQRASLLDTMTDILFNTLGATVFTLLVHFRLKGRLLVLDRLAIRSGTRQKSVQQDAVETKTGQDVSPD